MGSYNQAATQAASAYSGVAFVVSGLAVFVSINLFKPCAAALWPGGLPDQSPLPAPGPAANALCDLWMAEQIGSWSDVALGLVVAVAVAIAVFFFELIRSGRKIRRAASGDRT